MAAQTGYYRILIFQIQILIVLSISKTSQYFFKSNKQYLYDLFLYCIGNIV